jgi:hypothetical protein
VTPAADVASYPVLVDKMHAHAASQHNKHRRKLHLAGTQPMQRADEDTVK